MPVLQLPDIAIEYIIKKNRRARHMRLTMRSDLRLTVSVPYFISQKTAINFVEAHRKWIEQKRGEYIKSLQNNILSSAGSYKDNKEKARALIIRKISLINSSYNFSFKRIAVKNSRSRWGSCSKKGNLNFNYKLLFLPDHLSDYIITHELCHLKEMNHSQKFWGLVARTIPDWQKRRLELRQKYNLL